MRKPALRIAAVLLSLLATFALFEAVAFVVAGFRPLGTSDVYYNRACASFDRIYGYRYRPGDCRVAKIASGQLSYDRTFLVNADGFVDPADYVRRKAGDHVFRIAVFGDSFTEASFLPESWPQRLESMLNADSDGQTAFEIYNFAVDGGGLTNWHRIFFKDLVPNYEFDAVIIASYVDNLSRRFTVMQMDGEHAYFGRFGRPFESERMFLKHGLPHMEPRFDVVSDAEIDQRVLAASDDSTGWRLPSPRLHGLAFVRDRLSLLFEERRVSAELEATARATERLGPQPSRGVVQRHLEARYGKRNAERLVEILDYCRAHAKPVILASIPHKEMLIDWLTAQPPVKNSHQRELEIVAGAFGSYYFDGYDVFAGLAPSEVDARLWLYQDGHWNGAGSERFAAALDGFVRSRSRAGRLSMPSPATDATGAPTPD